MDIVEILIMDHLSIRLLIRCTSFKVCAEEFSSLHNFIVNCHAKIEDEIIFPTMKDFYLNKFEEYVRLIEWIGNDHKLLKTLGDKIIEYGEKGDMENYKGRLSLYFKILLEHNLREEESLFPNWLREIDEKIRRKCSEEARKIIEEYGIEKYTKLTGLSNEAYRII